MNHTGEPWWIGAIKAIVIVNVLLISMAFLTLLERKVLARMQRRYGPNRAGPKGILQPFADLIKMVRKEAFAPMAAIDTLYIMAPAFAAFTALASFSVIPFG
jgi:NADH-quinone oxidoreductase subunit H